MVPVWDLPSRDRAESLEEPVVAFAGRLAEALADSDAAGRRRSGGPGPGCAAASSPCADRIRHDCVGIAACGAVTCRLVRRTA